MRIERFKQITDDLFRAGFALTHQEDEYSLFSDGSATIELNHFEGIEVEE